MTIEERLRVTAEAVTEVMRPVRPLDLRAGQAEDPAPARPRRVRLPRRRPAWPGWLAPVTAAAVVVALAISLAVLHQARSSTADGGPAWPAQVPRYFAAIVSPPARAQGGYLTVGDVRTGRTLATIAPPKGQEFLQVAAGAGDRTFVLSSLTVHKSSVLPFLFYLIRVTPGARRPVTMAKLPVQYGARTPLPAPDLVPWIGSLALSPNGRELAILAGGQVNAWVAIFSTATGAVLRTWSTTSMQFGQPFYEPSLTWLADGHRLAFLAAPEDGRAVVRTIDTRQPGTHLLRDSKVLIRLPHRCAQAFVAPAGGTVICTLPTVPLCPPSCTSAPSPAWLQHCGSAYVHVFSVATGKQLAAIKPPACKFSYAGPLWADASGSTFVFRSVIRPAHGSNKNDTLVVSANGHLTSFPDPFRDAPAVGSQENVLLYDVAL